LDARVAAAARGFAGVGRVLMRTVVCGESARRTMSVLAAYFSVTRKRKRPLALATGRDFAFWNLGSMPRF
jgi:hypothetical protein